MSCDYVACQRGNKVSGTFPPEGFINATLLQVVDFSNNFVSGTLPGIMADMVNLTALLISDMALSGSCTCLQRDGQLQHETGTLPMSGSRRALHTFSPLYVGLETLVTVRVSFVLHCDH